VQDILSDPSRGLGPDKQVPPAVLRNFELLMGKVRRTSMVFRFEYGSADLDPRAQQDIGRLARFLQSPAMAGKRFLLVGFADSKGGWSSNNSLANKRAVQVARELGRVGGIRVPQDSLFSFSYMAPTACNDSELGTGKNRRVEVWLTR
jgi:phosphate transport system substrate-binding protein